MRRNNNNNLSSNTFEYNEAFLEFVQEFPYQDDVVESSEQEHIKVVREAWKDAVFFNKNIITYQNAYKKSKDPVDAFALYFIYYYGLADKQDISEAKKYLEKAVKKSYAPAIIEKARLCRYGFTGFKKDFPEMLRLYQVAANLGDDGAKLKLAECYEKSIGIECNANQAKELYKEVYQNTKSSSWKVRAALVLFCSYKNRNEENKSENREWLDYAAEENEPMALFLRAECYRQGLDGYETNKQAALNDYQAAAKNGNVKAAFWLGECYLNGDNEFSIPRDTEEAKKLLEVVFNSNDTDVKLKSQAAFMLYHISCYLIDDAEGAQKYFSFLINHDPAQAYYEQARIYHKGTPFIQKDYKKAFENYQLATRYYNWHAKLELAYFYQTGRAGVVDQAQAILLLQEVYQDPSADHKSQAQAAFYLYIHYAKDPSRIRLSEGYLNFAANSGYAEAINYRNAIHEKKVAKQYHIEIASLKQQLAKFQKQMEPIQQRYKAEQDKLKAIEQINQNELMRIFYLHVQQLLNIEFIAAMQQSKYKRVANTEDLVAKGISVVGSMTPVPLLGGLFKIISALIEKHSDKQEEAKANAMSSNAASVGQFEVIAESVARKLTNIFCLAVECLPEESIIKLAKYLVQSMLEFIFSKEIDTRQQLNHQLVKAALKPREATILSRYFSVGDLKTLAPAITWKPHEIVCQAGWIKVHLNGEHSFHHNNAWRYGFLVASLPGIELPQGPWVEHPPSNLTWKEQVNRLLASYNIPDKNEEEVLDVSHIEPSLENETELLKQAIVQQGKQIRQLTETVAEQGKMLQEQENEIGVLWTKVRSLEQVQGKKHAQSASNVGFFSRSADTESDSLLGKERKQKTCCSIM